MNNITENDITKIVKGVCHQLLSEGVADDERTLRETTHVMLNRYNGEIGVCALIKDKGLIKNVFKNLMPALFNNANRAMGEKNGGKMSQKFYETMNKLISMRNGDTKRGVIDASTETLFVNLKLVDLKNLFTPEGEFNITVTDGKKRVPQDLLRIRYFFKALEDCGVNIKDSEKQRLYNGLQNAALNDFDEYALDEETRGLFFRICQTLGDKEAWDELNSFHFDTDVITDHRFSLQNRIRILAQALKYGVDVKTQLTYLATERQWERMNRIVVDHSHPYYGQTMNAGYVNKEDAVKFAQNQGKAIPTQNGKTSNQQNRALVVNANAALNNGGRTSYNAPYFDVSDTQVVEGMEDGFNNQIGMSNNLKGTLNDPALAAVEQMKGRNANQEINRTEQLNNVFGTTDYKRVNDLYKAACYITKARPMLKADNIEDQIKFVGVYIERALRYRLSKYTGDPKSQKIVQQNFEKLVNIGRILIQSEIGLPMNGVRNVENGINDRVATDALFDPVFKISTTIMAVAKRISGNAPQNINEAIDQYSSLIVLRDNIGKKINLLYQM